MTTNISKIQTALASITQETTLALFNLNLDCSLVKVDAPAEYPPFGNALTKFRRNQAEVGSAHRVARKLGMLFEDIVPQTPELIKAYGIRATEIIEFHDEQLSSKPGGRSDYGPFTPYVGVDGTFIWAAATSSGAAIAMHLLACLLAVTFTKKQLRYGTLAASTWDISRQDLANWDAKLQCHQLRLIIDNINLPVHTSLDAYRSVIETWQTCLKMMDALVQGNGQDVQNGSLFVAFRAWHIFPDLILLKNQKHIKQNDPLVKHGGVVTIGLERADSQNTSGVNWSVSLSHLQFYGNVERREGLFGTNMGQIERKLKIAIVASDLLISYVRETPTCTGDDSWLPQDGEPSDDKIWPLVESSWIHRLNQASKGYFRCTDEERKRFRQLMALGHKSYRHFRAHTGQPFGEIAVEKMLSHILEYESNTFLKLLQHFVNNISHLSVTIEHESVQFDGERSRIRGVKIRSMSDATKLNPDSADYSEEVHLSIIQCDMAKTPRLVKGLSPLPKVYQRTLEAIFGAFEFCVVASMNHLVLQDDSSRVIYFILCQPDLSTLDEELKFYTPKESLDISVVEFLLQEGLAKKEFLMHVLCKGLSTFNDGKVLQYFLDMCAVSSFYEKYDAPY
ncbi:hypothetical protein TWF594_005413 [Orbilia oligospora]|nr:hypothetical protein TWF594_005413 [Orbilia oligospora]